MQRVTKTPSYCNPTSKSLGVSSYSIKKKKKGKLKIGPKWLLIAIMYSSVVITSQIITGSDLKTLHYG